MRKNRDYVMFLDDIIECAEKIDEYTKNFTEQDFSVDEKTKDAVIVRVQIIGEAIKNLPVDFKKSHKNIDWKKSVKLRNIFIHAYFGINSRRLWKTATKDIPELKEKMLELLKELKINKLI